MSTLTLNANVAFIEYNKSFKINGTIDTSMSKAEIKGFKVVLGEITTLFANNGHVRS